MDTESLYLGGLIRSFPSKYKYYLNHFTSRKRNNFGRLWDGFVSRATNTGRCTVAEEDWCQRLGLFLNLVLPLAKEKTITPLFFKQLLLILALGRNMVISDDIEEPRSLSHGISAQCCEMVMDEWLFKIHNVILHDALKRPTQTCTDCPQERERGALICLDCIEKARVVMTPKQLKHNQKLFHFFHKLKQFHIFGTLRSPDQLSPCRVDEFQHRNLGFATMAIHAGQDPEKWNSAAVVPPITTSTTFKQPAPAEHTGFEYGRSGNPTRNTLEECMAALDGGKHGFTFASGLGATTTIVSLLSGGDHIISSDHVYGGTNRLFRKVVERFNIETTFTDFTNIKKVENAIKSNTKMIWIETPTNPLLKVVDISEIAKIAKKHGDIIVVVDNTFLTSYLQKPLDFGADVVMYSLTKYMNGHSDVIMGAAVLNDDALAEKLRFLQNAMGVVPSPFDCYLVNRSLKTLALRMEQHKKSSLIIANWLLKHPKIVNVLHPGLPSHPQHDIAKKQTSGHSGLFSFVHTGDLKESRKFLSSLNVFTLAESLGGYESLAELPSVMTHASVPAEQRAELGITDSLIRLSVGLEDTDDLVQDLEQAFKAAFD